MTLIHPLVGQSNGWGKGRTTYPVTGVHYRAAVNGGIVLLKDGSGNLKANVGSDSLLGFSTGREDGWYSLEGAYCDALVAGGLAGPHVTVPCCVNGTEAIEWVEHLTQSPIHTDGSGEPKMVEDFKIRTRSALRITGAQLGAIVIYNGESNASTNTPELWGPNWTTFCDYVNIYFAAYWASALHYCVVQLPPNVPEDGGTGWLGWDDVRAAQAAFVAGRSDCVMVTADDSDVLGDGNGPQEDYHLDTASLVITGGLAGAAVAEAMET